MRKLKTLLPFNYFHYYAFSLLIACLAYENLLFLSLFILLFYLIRKYKHKYITIFIGITFFVCLKLIKIPKPPTNNKFIIIDIKTYDTHYEYEVRSGLYKYLFKHKNKYEVGDYLLIDYEIEKFNKAKTPNGFNAFNYYASKNIFYELKVNKITFIKHSFHINSIRYKLMDLFKNYPDFTKKMVYSLIFAHDTFSKEFKENSSLLGVSHLFSLSGMHINIIITLLFIFLKNYKKKELIVIIILTIYVLILGFKVSLFRAYLMVLVSYIFKKEGITKLDSLSLSFIIILLINPFNRYSLGFILSFLVTFFLVVVPTKNIIFSNLIAYTVSLLIVSNINGGLLLIGAISSLIYTLIFPFVIMPLVLFSLIPGFYFISEKIFLGFQESYNLFPTLFIKLPYVSLGGIIVYLGLFIYLLFGNERKTYFKRGLILVSYLFIIYSFPNLSPQGEVLFLDVNQGDTTFIKRPFNKCNILIDAHYGTSNYLKTLGDIEIDYFFITHGDYDHASEASSVIKSCKIKNAYTNPYDNSEIISELGLKKTRRGDKFICGDVEVKVLSPNKDYLDSNDNSLVLKIIIDKETYLFTGDISSKVEDDLVEFYLNDLKSDYLHISHHGSNTSTSNHFLTYVNPHTAIISVGKNKYGHPSYEVLERLRKHNIKILETLKENTIIIKKYRYRKKEDLLYK